MTTVLRIHRDIFPRTDHGHTWVEGIWFERDGEKVSPTIPSAGACERLGSMPGGPVRCDLAAEQRHYAPERVERVVKTETTHAGYYHVGPVCIVPQENEQ